MYKLICVDLDGTLLNTHQKVSITNKNAIRKALDAGIDVAIVSGRPNCFTIRIMNQISGRMGHITFNGAYYRVGNKTKSFPIDKDVVLRVAKLAKKYNVRTFFKNKNFCICTKSDAGFLDYDLYKEQTPVKDRMDIHYNVDVEEYLNNHEMDVLKIFSMDDDYEDIEHMAEEVAKEERIYLFAYNDYFEMCSRDTNKGKAIEAVCKDLNINLEDVVCLGDSYNDMSMLKVAGLSIAMANAPQTVKDVCDKVTLSNDDNGVAYAIDNFVLGDK